ncbi:hypothetical protein HPP92_015692 [Vanilla planifolia]|uniref:Uncharacterized protein n=1 Tax=Vanilla planifolia TaxID=51239 RepID=A0A835PFD0_VANPL|nr:hypothetical protein HPP92_026359 [Vanilla planifolia]KAG0471146.1 hypothetical protein HPP92_015692 [Vanilla planifolia]
MIWSFFSFSFFFSPSDQIISQLQSLTTGRRTRRSSSRSNDPFLLALLQLNPEATAEEEGRFVTKATQFIFSLFKTVHLELWIPEALMGSEFNHGVEHGRKKACSEIAFHPTDTSIAVIN